MVREREQGVAGAAEVYSLRVMTAFSLETELRKFLHPAARADLGSDAVEGRGRVSGEGPVVPVFPRIPQSEEGRHGRKLVVCRPPGPGESGD